MFEASRYRIRRRRQVDGFDYEVIADGRRVLAWTRHSADLASDFDITTPAGKPVIRITAENLVPSVDAAYTVVDRHDGSILGLIRRDWHSVVRREFMLVDRFDLAIAAIRSRSRALHVARQQLIKVLPYWYAIADGDGRRIGLIRGGFRGGCTLSLDRVDAIDHRLAVAAAIAVDAVELLV